MEETVYLDVLFLINFIANYLILHATARIMRRDSNRLRCALGAAVGAVYAVLMFLPLFAPIYFRIFRVGFSFIIVLVSFKYKSLYSLCKAVAVFYVVCFLFGGGVIALHYLAGPIWELRYARGIVYANIPAGVLIVSVLCCYGVLCAITRLLKTEVSSDIVRMIITVGDRCAEVTAMIDTGHTLVDPFSNKPVVVVEYESVKNLFPQRVRPLLRQNRLLKLSDEEDVPREWMYRFRVISYNSLGGQGVLPAVRTDNIKIIKEDGSSGTVSGAIIAVSSQSFDNNVQAISSPLILEV